MATGTARARLMLLPRLTANSLASPLSFPGERLYPMRERDFRLGHLPFLTRTRPALPPHDPETVMATAEALFGCEGEFFTVPGSFPEVPDHLIFSDTTYAVLRTPSAVTDETWYTVRDVDGHRQILGEPGPRKIDTVRSALSQLAKLRMEHVARVTRNRVDLLGLPPVPAVRLGHDELTPARVLHVRCGCDRVPGLSAHYENLEEAADRLNGFEAISICPTSFSPAATLGF
ncbi:hypothetical protein [Streptomyces sp. NPDC008121]|uniref:hypothetical protein n=1 Tax=Streptomyces sp. NPDC008121 TaxID=3364809 RepID=UPI0036E15FC0